VIEDFEIPFADGSSAHAFRIERREELGPVAQTLVREGALASMIVLGGADGVTALDLWRLQPLFTDVLAELAFRFGAAVVDGGTDTGVMRLMGRARANGPRDFPLVGVAVASMVRVPGEAAPDDAADLEPNHTHFVLVPGDRWGDEGPWLAELGEAIGGRTATVLVNGGEITRRDAELCVQAGRPLIVVAGSGRTADDLAAAAIGRAPDEESARIAATGLVRPVELRDRDGLAWLLDDVLAGRA
jgi:hypothetical protein